MKKFMIFAAAVLLLAGCAQTPQPVRPSSEAAAIPQTTAQTAPPETTAPADPLRTILDGMTLEEKVGQLFLARCRKETAVSDVTAFHPGGYILFGRDFDDRTPDTLRAELAAYQSAARIPMLLAVDEEGGTVCRVSSHSAFRAEKFLSPRESYALGGLEVALGVEWDKAYLLNILGLNVNLAPVCDISTTPGAFMYDRSLGQGPQTTAEFVTGALTRMAQNGVGGVMKHFPGYGDNTDTHTGSAVDTRSLAELESRDLIPFQAGIDSGLGAVLVSHNTVTALDSERPASVSPAVMTYLRQNMGFTGVILTDDLSMGALDGYTAEEAAVLALQAGATMLCSTDFDTQIPAVLEAVQNGRLSEAAIDDAVYKLLTWKQSLGLLSPS